MSPYRKRSLFFAAWFGVLALINAAFAWSAANQTNWFEAGLSAALVVVCVAASIALWTDR